MSNKLSIGDQDSAIIQIQQSQTDPQKALSELIENSIDAKAKNIEIIRRKHGKEVEIIVLDDGEGVKPGENGNPDFKALGCRICDSIKRKYSRTERQNVQGQFGIGLLGFAAIGDNLEMLSRTETSKTMKFTLKKGIVEFDDPQVSLEELKTHGTQVKIWPIWKEIQQRLTAEKINIYLGQELRERIRVTNVNLSVDDRLYGSKKIIIKPRPYKGEKIKQIDKVNTPSGNIHFKLHITQEGEFGHVSVLRHGTKVVDDISELAELNHSPWSGGMVEGDVDSKFINTSPATRKGIVPDKYYSEFVKAVKSIEAMVESELKKVAARREEKLSRDIIKTLQEAFADLMNELPDEYAWFDIKKGPGITGKGTLKGHGGVQRPSIRLSSGPLDTVSISPPIVRIEPGESKELTAKAWTSDGALILIDIKYKWRIKKGHHLGTLQSTDNVANFTAGEIIGDVTLEVTATQDKINATAEAQVIIWQSTSKNTQYPFPQPIPIERPDEPWRSRFLPTTNQLEYNSGHNDYLSAKEKGGKYYQRYIAFLYAKHLVLHNFPKSGEDNVLERMIEVISALESRIK